MSETQTTNNRPDTFVVLPPEWARSANDLWEVEHILTPDVIKRNKATHAEGWEGRCCNCDCRIGGAWSKWACDAGRADYAVTFARHVETITANV